MKTVITLSGGSYLLGAAVQAMELRHLGCDWRHVVYTVPGDEVSDGYRRVFDQLGSEVREVKSYKGHPWTAKTNAVIETGGEVLFLDSDNIPLIDPEVIRLDGRYRSKGAVFWRDFETMEVHHPLYHLCGVTPLTQQAQEAGQLLIDVDVCGRELATMDELNDRWNMIYPCTRGDKDMWRMAWMKCGTQWEWASPDIGILLDNTGHGRAIIQKWGDRPAFHHRVHAKFTAKDNWWQPGLPLRWFAHIDHILSRL